MTDPSGKIVTLAQGDTILTVAQANGFRSWETVWHHEQNTTLREQRLSSADVAAGDALFVPPFEVKAVSVAAFGPDDDATQRYTFVLQSATPLAGDADLEPATLSLLVPEKAGVAYTFDDGINPSSDGIVHDDGLLVHPVAATSTSGTLTFKDDNIALELHFETDALSEADVEPVTVEDDLALTSSTEEALDALADDDEEEAPALTFIVPEKAGVGFQFDDGKAPPHQGTVADDGLLLAPVTPGATGGKLKFDDESEALELFFATD